MSLPAISPKKMQTPDKKPEQKMPEKPEKNVGEKNMLPLLASAKADGVVKNLFPMPVVPKLKLPEVKPDSGYICPAPRKEEEVCEPVEMDIYELREQSYREFKLDMEMDNAWR
jgi:hypothetical protein